MLTIFNVLLVGTVILGVRTPDAVYVGIDSRVVALGPTMQQQPNDLKIHQYKNVVFAHAGLFKDTSGKFDVYATAQHAIDGGGSLDEIVDRFIVEIEPQLRSILPMLLVENPGYARSYLKRPVEVLFASATDRTPRMAVAYFEVTQDAVGLVSVRPTRLSCPGNCPDTPSGAYATGLGDHDAADRFFDSHLRSETRGMVYVIKEAILAQANATPNLVGPPAIVCVVKVQRIDCSEP